MSPEHCLMARNVLSWSVRDLASYAGVGVNTVSRFENGEDSQRRTIERMQLSLESGGVVFETTTNGEPVVKLSNKVWLLRPIDLEDHNWMASTHKCEAIIRAPSERAARWRAHIAFWIAAAETPSGDKPFSPWRHPKFVHAQIVDDERYPADGPSLILAPTDGEPSVPRELAGMGEGVTSLTTFR